MVLRLPRLNSGAPIVDKEGIPTKAFTRFWDEFATAIEGALNNITDALAAADIAQAAADTAIAAAATAQTSADSAAADAAAAQAAADAAAPNDLVSLQQSGVSSNCAINGQDIGPDAQITISAHTRYYGDGTSVAVNAGNGAGLVNDTVYWVYYDDPTRAGGAVTYIFATTSADSFPSDVNPDRHYVGKVTTPATGQPDTDGEPNFWAG